MTEARILVLEDDANMRAELSDVLSEEGFQVDAVGQGEEAVRRMLDSGYDLLVADVRMEGIDGLEAVARMRQQDVRVPVLVITGYVSEADSIRAIRLGVGDYLRKPFRQEEFLEVVHGLLARTAAERAQARRMAELRDICHWLGGLEDPAPRLAGQLARGLGLDEHQRLLAQLACRAAADGDAPATVRALAEHREERWDGTGPRGLRGEEIQLEARVAALSRARLEQPDLPLASFLDHHRGRFDPYLPELLDAPDEDHGKTLTIAATLLDLGDSAAARQLLAEVREPRGRSRMEASLLAARLDPSVEAYTAAVESATSLGPRVRADCQRRAALATLELAPAVAQRWLRECHDGLGEPAEQAQVRLAYQSLQAEPAPRPEDIRLLLASQHELLRIRSLGWLLPLLWKHERALAEKLVAEYPSTAARLVAAGRLAPQVALEQGTPSLTLRSFGVFQVLVGEQPVDERAWRGSRVKHLFAFLASQETVHEERALDLFWADGTEKGRRGLSSALSVIRRALPREADYVVRRGDLLGVNAERIRWHDLSEWEAAMKAGTVESWRTAVNLYAGPYLDGCYMDWALERRTRLEAETLSAALRVAAADLEAGRYGPALAMADRAQTLDDCSQEAQLAALRALVGLGRPEQAIRRFEGFQKTLSKELGLEPSLELLEWYHRARLSS